MSVARFFSAFLFQPLYNLNSSGGAFGFQTGGGYYTFRTLTGVPQRPVLASPSTSYPSLLYNQQTIEQYYAIMDMLTEMYMLSVGGLATRFLADAITRTMNTTPSVVINITDQDIAEKARNIIDKWLAKVDIIKIIKNIMNDIVYYGSYSFWIDEEYNLHNIYDPVSVITVIGQNMLEFGYLVNTYEGIQFIKKSDSHILRIGLTDLLLYTDIFNLRAETYHEYVKNFQNSKRASSFVRMYSGENKKLLSFEEKTFIRPYIFMAATPLFYFTRTKLREYIIKDIVLGLTTLRDLLYPLVFMLQYDYPPVQYTVQSLADQIEEILNVYADIGGIIGVKSNLTHILQTITYSIRVLPDFKGYISNLQPLDTSKLTEKLDKYRGEMKDLLEDISNDIGWPVDAFNSRITYWESMRQSERFNNRVNYITNSIEKSLSIFLSQMIAKELRLPYQEDLVNVNIFSLTITKLVTMSTAFEATESYINGTLNLISEVIEKIKDSEYINREEIIKIIKTYLQILIPNSEVVVEWDKLAKYEEEATEEGGEEY